MTVRLPADVMQRLEARARARGASAETIALEAIVAGLDRPDRTLPNAKD